MRCTWSSAFMCHRYLPELIANWSLKSDPKLDAGSSADFSLVPLTWTGCEAASADGAIRKLAVARAADATILVRSDIGAIPVLRLSSQAIWRSPPRTRRVISRGSRT